LLHPATLCSLSIAHPIGRSLRRTMLIDARQKENAPKSSLHTTVCFGDAMTCAE
jgi:hypothetical protein